MARTMIEHSCEGCGAIRKVSPDKLAKGLQRVCRKCQGPAAAEKRRIAMLKRGGPKHVTYGICKECRSIYEMASMDDDGYCRDKCRQAGAAHSPAYLAAVRSFLYGKPRRHAHILTYKAEQLSLLN